MDDSSIATVVGIDYNSRFVIDSLSFDFDIVITAELECQLAFVVVLFQDTLKLKEFECLFATVCFEEVSFGQILSSAINR